MLQVVIEQQSVDQLAEYLERTKLAIFAKMREGMREAMEGLAGEVVSQAMMAGIHNKTGQLFTDILNSPKVSEGETLIWGGVTTKSDMTIAGRTFEGYLGTALDEGFRVPESKAKVYQFTSANAGTRFTRGHVAFDVKPHPFLHRAKEAFSAPIMEIIQKRVAEAYR